MGKNSSLTVLTAVVLCVCYIMTASLYLGLKNFNNFILAWGKDLQMTVYLKEDSSSDEVEELVQILKTNAEIQAVTKVSSQENLAQFKKQMGSFLPELENQTEIQAMVPSTLQVLFNLKDSLVEPIKAFASVAESISTHSAVEQVSYGQMWVEKFSKFFTFVRQSLWALSVVLLLASLFVFSNSVRAWVSSKRYEIEVMELVGATPWMIRKPFIIKGALLGLTTGVLAITFVLVAANSLKASLMESETLVTMAESLQTFSLVETLVFIVFSVLLGLLATYICVREINSGWAAAERT